MANCIKSIEETPIEMIPILSPHVQLPFSTSSTENSLMIMRNAVPEVLFFSVVIDPVDYEIELYVNFYRIEDNGDTFFLGNAIINDFSVNFQKDVQIGNYIICISTNIKKPFSGYFSGEFTSFPPYAILSSNFRTGEILSKPNIELPHVQERCKYPVFYEILDGKLPPGISLSGSGWLKGILPDLDCIEENSELSGSQNWYFQSGTSWHPWGRQWRFLVRAFVHSSISDEAEDQEWFCISVFNNWDWDRDNFMNNKPFENVVDVLKIENMEYHLEDICNENKEIPITNNINISKIVLCPQEKETDEKLTEFIRWYLQFGNNLESSNLHCQEMIDFISDFKETLLYQSLINKVKDQFLIKSPEEIEKIALESYIKDIEERKINGRFENHIDYQMLKKKDNVNQTLPISGNVYDAISIHIDLNI